MTNNIKIMLLNVNGLNLQETYLSQFEHKLIYGNRNLYHCTFKEGYRRGVVTLVSNTTQFDLEDYKDKKGRYIVVKGILKKKSASNINEHMWKSDKYFFSNTYLI